MAALCPGLIRLSEGIYSGSADNQISESREGHEERRETIIHLRDVGNNEDPRVPMASTTDSDASEYFSLPLILQSEQPFGEKRLISTYAHNHFA